MHLLSKFPPNRKEAPVTVEAKLLASPEEQCLHLYAMGTGNSHSGGIDVQNGNYYCLILWAIPCDSLGILMLVTYA